MLTEIVSLVTDIGLGALAYSLARSLKTNVVVMQGVIKDLVLITKDHEERLTALEKERERWLGQ